MIDQFRIIVPFNKNISHCHVEPPLNRINDQHLRRHTSYRQRTGDRVDDDVDLPEFSFSHAVSCEVRAHPEYIILDLDLVRQMESTVTWQKSGNFGVVETSENLWETCGNYMEIYHFLVKHGETQCTLVEFTVDSTNFGMIHPMNPEAVSAFQEVLRLGQRWSFGLGVVQKHGEYLENYDFHRGQ